MNLPFAIMSIVGAGLFYNGLRMRLIAQKIENTPTSKVRSIAIGLVEVMGKIKKFEQTLSAPFTSKECVYYKILIEELRSNGKSSSWVTIKEETLGTKFYIEDETGKVLVDPKEAEINLKEKMFYESGMFKQAPPSEGIKKYLSSIKFGPLNLGPSRRFKEYRLDLNSQSYVLGSAMENSKVKEASARHEENLIIAKGKNEKTFYISEGGEKEVLSGLNIQAWIQLVLGIILIVAGILIVLLS